MAGKRPKKAPEVTSVLVTMQHVRAAGAVPGVARQLFQRHNLDWQTFLANGADSAGLKATGDALAIKIAETAEAEQKPIEQAGGELRVYHRHIRSAELCMKGSREFFRKHDLDWNDFLTNGIAVSTLEEIGDPIALRAAHEAIAEEAANGRK